MATATLTKQKAEDFVVADGNAVTVYSTTHYDQFVYDPRNRPIDWDHVQELFDSICEKNLLADYPIVTESRGGHLVVLDGQHRLEVAKILEVPIFCRVSETMKFEDVHRVNGAVQKWDNFDYLNRWLREGRPEYIRFKDFVEKRPHMGYTFCLTLLMTGSNKQVRVAFRNGTYMCDNMEAAETLADAVKSLEPYAKDFYTHAYFMVALRVLLENPRYDHATLLKKLEYQSIKMRKQPDHKSYVAMLLEIYNYKSRGQELTLGGVVYRS